MREMRLPPVFMWMDIKEELWSRHGKLSTPLKNIGFDQQLCLQDRELHLPQEQILLLSDHERSVWMFLLEKKIRIQSTIFTLSCIRCLSVYKLSLALQSGNSLLQDRDLINYDLQDSGVELPSADLMNSHCKLKILRLIVTTLSCEKLLPALQSGYSLLQDLDLSKNDLQDSGVKLLFAGLQLSEAVPSRIMLVERVLVSFFAVKVLLSLSWCTAAHHQHGPFVYTWDQLIALKPAGMDTRTANIPEELWRRTHRGCRGGTKQRTGKSRAKRRRLMEKKGYKPRLPTLIMGNVRSLANKMDELAALAMSQKEYRQCSLMCFSETWLHQDIPDDNVSITGFQTVRADRDCTESGDFNHVTMARTLPNFTQYVDCPTREERTLDLLYANVKSQPVTTRTVRRWSEETSEVLQDCFETTDWTALYEPHGEDIDGLTECITDYINFCVDSTVPTRTVKCYPNNKPWVTKDIKALLNKKKRAFRAGDREEVRTTQRELKRTIREAKDRYRRKLEWKLQQNNMREVWSGMRTITGFRSSNNRGVEGSVDRANCKL
ncbi:hypothetical protein NFI96_006182 [Prochilodus magdalenae]|nr:hypothetical protein NFI96_006182 [Prochilodus magdalenae]